MLYKRDERVDEKKKNLQVNYLNNKNMLKKTLSLLTLLLFASFGFSQTNEHHIGDRAIKISSVSATDRGDTIYVDFKLLQGGRKKFDHSLLKRKAKESFSVTEEGTPEKYQPIIDTILDIRSQKKMGDDLSIMLLIDRSSTVPENLMSAQRDVVRSFMNAMPDTKLYISFMNDGTVTQTMRVDSTSFIDYITTDFNPGNCHGEKNLYRSILSRLQELSGEKQTYYPEVPSHRDFESDEGDKILFVFTDGKVKNDKGEYYGGLEEQLELREDYWNWEDAILDGKEKNIPVYCVYIGEKENLDGELKNTLGSLCISGGEDDMKGHFYTTLSPDSLENLMMGTLDSIASDYRLVLYNPEGKLYDGAKLALKLSLIDAAGNEMAYGERNYSLGSVMAPLKVQYRNVSFWHIFLIGLLLGLLLLVTVYAVVQYLIPYISYKQFEKKYIVPFSASAFGVKREQCMYCKGFFVEGDPVVTKCEHHMHKHCWEKNRYRCIEYGHQCKTGIHFYDKEHLSDPQNASHFLPWIIAGLVSGLFSWLFFRIFHSFELFTSLMAMITESVYPFEGEVDVSIVNAAVTKTSGWLQGGISLGFFLTLAFGYVVEYRKKDSRVIGQLLLRSLCGTIMGFLAFLLGILIVVASGKHETCLWLDWIPWLFFAVVISLVLWYRSEVKLKSALIGGSLSILFSFLVMYVFTGNYTPVFGYMVYATGFGCSIAVVHFRSQKYFLRIDGSVKERDIAIYKWMSATGGFNHVSIGKSIKCVLQMNWDKSEGISDRAVELYLDKNERPILHVLDEGVTQNGRGLAKGTELILKQGSEFTIGQTRFTYIEKDKKN